MNKRDGLTGGAKQLEAVVTVAASAESCGKRVVEDKSGGECGGDDMEGIVGGGSGSRGVEVGTEVTEGDVEVRVGIEMGEREDMILLEGLRRGGDGGGV